MKRAFRVVALFAALALATLGTAAAHDISVSPPGGGEGTEHGLAKRLTPRIFDADGNYVGDSGTNSAASQGTNTACEAIPPGGPVTITGGSC